MGKKIQESTDLEQGNNLSQFVQTLFSKVTAINNKLLTKSRIQQNSAPIISNAQMMKDSLKCSNVVLSSDFDLNDNGNYAYNRDIDKKKEKDSKKRKKEKKTENEIKKDSKLNPFEIRARLELEEKNKKISKKEKREKKDSNHIESGKKKA